MNKIPLFVAFALLFSACSPPPLVDAPKDRTSGWTETSFRDFADGTLVDGGANTYISADGSIRLINQLDLNQDGLIDLVLPGSHDNNFQVDSWIYWGADDFSASSRTALPGEGASGSAIGDFNADGHLDVVIGSGYNGTRTENNSVLYWGGEGGLDRQRKLDLPTVSVEAVAAADLNLDGYVEIVFASNGLSYQFTREGGDFTVVRPFSDIYWGSSDGYSPRRTTQLPTHFAQDVEIADLNQDEIPDILFANQGRGEEAGGVLIYWGSESGEYSKALSTRLDGLGAAALRASDLNRDGWPEIVVVNNKGSGSDSSTPVPCFIYWGSPEGFSGDRRTELPGWGARGLDVSDLDGDGQLDLVFANEFGDASFIYWGSESGFLAHRRTALPTLAASDCVIADLNGDKLPDIVFSNEKNSETHDISSFVYWNSKNGFERSNRLELATMGAAAVESDDLDGDGKRDLIFIHKKDGYVAEDAPNAYVYWGQKGGEFSSDRRWVLPYNGGSSANIADLNADGFTDVLLTGRVDILWGSADGFSLSNNTKLPTERAFSTVVADFNRDGYLDLSVSEWTPEGEEMSLLWGAPGGYRMDNRFIFRFPDVRLHKAGDFDRNGYLDLLFTGTSDQVVIFWNGPEGFSNQNKQYLPTKLAVGAEVADLNADGYLDLIICNLYDFGRQEEQIGDREIDAEPQSATFSAGTEVYWGGEAGYSLERKLVLDTVGSEDASVADLNGDGHLDLVVSSYHAGIHRSHPSYLFWGTGSGLNPEPTLLPTDSGSGVIVADFNQDAQLDIFFVCHTKGGNHRTDSFLYWGEDGSFSADRRLDVPTRGVHWTIHNDVGDIYDRSPGYDYISSPFDVGETARFGSLSWHAQEPFETDLKFQLRGASSQEDLVSAEWLGPEGADSFYTESSTAIKGLPEGVLWIQYKATLLSPNGANVPVLESVTVDYR